MNKYLSVLIVSACLINAGCTSNSTILAQQNNIKVQASKDGIHSTMFTALARENYETAKKSLEINALRLQLDMSKEQRKDVDVMLSKSVDALKEFAQKRDMMTEFSVDYERANALKYVTVDAKLFSEQGILNYIVSRFSAKTKEVWNAWDKAEASFNSDNK